MALYDYRCRTCDERFEVERPMTAVVTSTPCPDGHLDTVRLLSSFATTGAAASSRPAMAGGGGGGGGCCGGGCGCAR
jgi:putative FmdB family regulatory protein